MNIKNPFTQWQAVGGKRFSSREKGVFIAFLSVSVIYALYLGIYQPSQSKRGNLESDTLRARKQLVDETRLIRQVRALAAQYGEDLAVSRQTVSNEQAMSTVLAEIETAARSTQVRITEMKPRGVDKKNNINTFAVNLTLTGGIKQIMQFIHALQTPPHNLNVSEFNIERSVQDQKTITVVVGRILIP